MQFHPRPAWGWFEILAVVVGLAGLVVVYHNEVHAAEPDEPIVLELFSCGANGCLPTDYRCIRIWTDLRNGKLVHRATRFTQQALAYKSDKGPVMEAFEVQVADFGWAADFLKALQALPERLEIKGAYSSDDKPHFWAVRWLAGGRLEQRLVEVTHFAERSHKNRSEAEVQPELRRLEQMLVDRFGAGERRLLERQEIVSQLLDAYLTTSLDSHRNYLVNALSVHGIRSHRLAMLGHRSSKEAWTHLKRNAQGCGSLVEMLDLLVDPDPRVTNYALFALKKCASEAAACELASMIEKAVLNRKDLVAPAELLDNNVILRSLDVARTAKDVIAELRELGKCR